MPPTPSPVGRRERNKQQKLDRIVAAATELFAERGVEDVTTQQIADRADIGTGTLFLYAKTKGELLLLVQNSSYEEALATGVAEAEATRGRLDAVMAILNAIVHCNRVQVDNGRIYLREVVFGDPEEPHHGEALSLTTRTMAAIARVLMRDGRTPEARATAQARIITSIMFVTLAPTLNAQWTDAEISADIRSQVEVVLGTD